MAYEAIPVTRIETYLKALATGDSSELPEPVTGTEYALNYMIQNGSLTAGASRDADPVTWAEITGKPSVFPPKTGATATDAKAGDWKPSASDITDASEVGKAVLKAVDKAAAKTAIGVTDYTDAKAQAAIKGKAQIAALTAITDPATATPEAIANALNSVIAALKA